jgi:signal transduction histidine kinase/ligand-binding sensor domain-containing protein
MHRHLRAVVLIALASAGSAVAQQTRGRLPLESFSVAQGLANDSVTTIRTDSRGFVWFGTLDGLSRYDGTRFVNYTTADGIPDRMIWSIAEDRGGAIWIGTSGGAAELAPGASRGRALFRKATTPSGKPVDALKVVVDRKGTIWSTCDSTLCTVQDGRLEVDRSFSGDGVQAIADTPSGELWVGTEHGLFRRHTDGSWRRYAVQPHRGGDTVNGLLSDSDGRLWIATGWGVLVFAPDGDDRDVRPIRERAGKPLMPGDALRLPKAGEAVMIVAPHSDPIIGCKEPFRARDGIVWVPCYIGLLRVGEGNIEIIDANDGLPPDILAAGEDPTGDIWIGTRAAGAFRLARSGATTFTRAHGLANDRIMSVFTLDDGTICSTNRKGLSCFRDGEIHHGSLWPRGNRFPGWGWNQVVLRGGDGTWWFATGEGLVRWPRVQRIEDFGRVAPMAIYTTRDGLDHDDVFRVWQDSRGTVWVGTFGQKPLSRGDPATGRFTSFGAAEGFPQAAPTAFAEDWAGNVWIGLYTGGLVRVAGDRFERIARGLPGGLVRDLKIDSRGRLWIAATGGVACIETPSADAAGLVVRRYPGNSGYCVVEMADGRMAIGSQRGLDVFDPRGGSVVHLSMRDGLASNEVTVAAIDRRGALWLGTVSGLSRLARIPPPRIAPPPRPRIEAISIDGIPQAVAELGATAVGGVRVEYPRHAMTVGFSAPHYDPEHPLRFEYRLAANADWIDVGSQRAVVFDRLPSGSGTFEVRASTAGGTVSAPAQVSFTAIPPIWRRTWFIALALALVSALAFLGHRTRVAHLVALERVRTRVATDLHDDLGSSLSRISILSEIAKRKLVIADSDSILDEIANSARGLVDALGDSIWAIDPRRDDVRSLLLRVHHFAAAVFEAQSIAIDLHLPPDVAPLPLRPEQRRETYLILKEALNNTAKHAGARHVAVVASADAHLLRIGVRDDGKGFAVKENDGRGLPSMLDRARRAGGSLEVVSEPGHGTSVTVSIPI